MNKQNMAPVEAITYEEFITQYNSYRTKLKDLRKSGTDQIKILENENRKIKGNRLMEGSVKGELIAKNLDKLSEAKAIALENKQSVKELVKESTLFVKTNHKQFFAKTRAEVKQEKIKEKARYKEEVLAIKTKFAQENEEIKELKTTDPENYSVRSKLIKQSFKQASFESKTLHQEKNQKIKDKLHESFNEPYEMCAKLKDGKKSIIDNLFCKAENYVYTFNPWQFLFKNGLYIIILIFMIGCIAYNSSLIDINAINLILKNFSTKVFFALGVAGLILLAGTDLSVGRMVTLGTMITCMILNPETTVEFFGISFNGIYESGGFGLAVFAALSLSVLMCTLFSVVAGLFTAKFKIHPFISTLGTSLVIWGLVGYGTNNIKTGTISNDALAIGQSVLKGDGFPGIPLTLIYAIVAIAIVWFIWNKTKFGKNMYAVGGNPEAASVSGISVFWTTLGVFIMAGVLYGLGGFFQSTVTGSSSSSFGQGWELEAIAACVIGGISFTGGIGKISGAVFGCLLFEILKYYLRDITGGSADISNIFIGVIILVAVTLDSLKYLKKK